MTCVLLFNNYWRALYWGGTEASTVDDHATRGSPAIRVPRRTWTGAGVTSDSRKPLYVTLISEVLRDERDGFADSLSLGLTYRPTTRLSLRLSPTYWTTRSAQQYVTTTADSRYVFAQLDQKTLDISVRFDWTFTWRLSLQLYMQPYVATGAYTGFYTLSPRSPSPIPPTNPDFNYRSLRGNAVLRWEFRPGSSLYVVWNDTRENELPTGAFHLGRDLRGTLDAPSRDVFMVKMSWWFGR